MKMVAYDYATLGFRPYPETQEFVTIGLVALDARTPEFGFALLDPRKVRRIHQMFPALPKEVYGAAWKALRQELEAIEEAVNFGPGSVTNDPDPLLAANGQGLFNAITSPREGLFSYQARGRRLAENLAAALNALQHRFIDQKTLILAPSIEVQMAYSLTRLLRKAGIMREYDRDVKIGPKEFQVPFTLARMSGHQKATRAIRPLNFDRITTTEVFNHGDEWIQKLRRLEKVGYRPDHCLFSVRLPQNPEGMAAYLQIKTEMEDQGVELAQETDEKAVLLFADPSEHRLC